MHRGVITVKIVGMLCMLGVALAVLMIKTTQTMNARSHFSKPPEWDYCSGHTYPNISKKELSALLHKHGYTVVVARDNTAQLTQGKATYNLCFYPKYKDFLLQDYRYTIDVPLCLTDARLWQLAYYEYRKLERYKELENTPPVEVI